ncbi:MAG: dipeptidase PepE [Thermomicrobiales bacterium]|nr:dipeptidase PepE [Thermomicrobiales bacterium]
MAAGHDLLLLSNSSVHGRGYLEHAMPAIEGFLNGRKTIAFAPFALFDRDGYTGRVQHALAPLGVTVTGLHTVDDPVAAVRASDVLFVGGGNSFRLLKNLQERQLLEPVRALVEAGQLAYMGSSAGTNMACPSLRTTNDMPIVQPASFESLGLIPFQINPHYLDPDPASKHMGETREQRISQFHEENDVAVLGVREGAWLRRQGDQLTLGGTTGARLMRRGQEAVEYAGGDDLSFLLSLDPRFDSSIS